MTAIMPDKTTTDPSTWGGILATYANLDRGRQERMLEYCAQLTIEHGCERTGHIGDVVRAMREGVGATVTELAQAAGIRRPSIVSIELGRETTVSERQDISAGIAWLALERIRADEALLFTNDVRTATA